MRILLVGHGKMGQLVGELAGQYDCEVAGVIDPVSPLHGGGPDADRWTGVEVAIDFITSQGNKLPPCPPMRRCSRDVAFAWSSARPDGPGTKSRSGR